MAVFCAIIFLLMPVNVFAEQFLLLDNLAVHTGYRRLQYDWEFVSWQIHESDAPKNWLTPVNYADGTIHMRFEFLSITEPATSFRIAVGFSNKEKDPTGQHCVYWMNQRVSETGVYDEDKPVKSFWHGPADKYDPVLPWDFENAYKDVSFFTIIDPSGSDFVSLFPVKLHVQVWIISKGAVFEPPSTSVADDSDSTLPREYYLQNSPNPFNPDTRIEFAIPVQEPVMLTVYDVMGRRVRELISDTLAAGRYSEVWDGRDGDGNLVASGIYVAQLRTAGGFTLSRKLTLMR